MTDVARRESEILLYAAPDGTVRVAVLFKDETAWLTQRSLAELFGVGIPAVNKHLKNIFESGELAESSAVSILETTAADGKTYKTRFHSLDAIIAVGYRVNSYQATQFRIWATNTLREFIIKGFVLDDERMKQGKTVFGKVSALEAFSLAEGEYEVYRQRQDVEFISDFDRVVEETKRLASGDPPKAIRSSTASSSAPRRERAPDKSAGRRKTKP